METVDIFKDANQFHTRMMVFVHELLVVTTNCILMGKYNSSTQYLVAHLVIKIHPILINTILIT
jgi:hypothetical protein